jgi:putative flavoprotein involved in K+ transport
MGLDLPEEPAAHQLDPDPPCVTNPALALDLAAAGITAIIWATGYALDFDWIEIDAFDAQGRPVHERGVATVPGLYFLGLPWLSRRASAFIWGVWHDAEYLAGHVAARSRSVAAVQ